MNYEWFLLKSIKFGIILVLFTPLILGPFGLTLSAYPKAVFFRSLVEIIFIFYLLLIFLNRKYIPNPARSGTVLVSAVFIFILILFFASITGINFYRSFFGDSERAEGLILHIHLFIFFLILISPAVSGKDWLKFFRISIIISAVSSFVGILQKFGIATFYGISATHRISGTLSNPDFFAPYVVLNIFLAIFIFIAEKNKRWKFIWMSILGLDFFALLLSGTRGAWVGIIIGLIFVFPVCISYFLKLEKRKRKIILFGFFFLTILFFLTALKPAQFGLENNELLTRFSSIFTFSLGSRADVWKIAFEAFKEKPILGWGPESFSFIFDKYFKKEYLYHIREEIYFDYPHNKIMGILSDSGILGLLSYLSIFFIIFYFLFKRRTDDTEEKSESRSMRDKNNLSFKLVLSGFFVSYFIQNLFSFDTVATYLIFFMVLGFVNNSFPVFSGIKENNFIPHTAGKKPAPFSKIGDRSVLALKNISVFSLIFLSLIAFYFVNLKPTIAAVNFPFSVEYEELNPKKAILKYKESLQNTIYDNDFAMIIIERGLYILEQGLIKDKEREKEFIDILYGLKSFLNKNLEKPDRRRNDTYEYLAYLNEKKYFVSQDPVYLKEMEKILKNALDFNNQRPEFYRLMGELKILQNNYKEGEEFFKKLKDIYPKEIEYETKFYRELGIAYFKNKDKIKAVENFKKALDLEYYYKKYNSQSAIAMGQKQLIVFTEAVAVVYCRELKDYETCRQIYERAIEIYPNDRNNLKSHLEILMKEKNK